MEYTIKSYEGDGWSGTVKRPILTPEEREKREKYIINTLISIYREVGDDEAIARLLLADSES